MQETVYIILQHNYTSLEVFYLNSFFKNKLNMKIKLYQEQLNLKLPMSDHLESLFFKVINSPQYLIFKVRAS